MGIDFYTCSYCDETFPDCGRYFRCDCGRMFCSDECGKRDIPATYNDDCQNTCCICRDEYILDEILLNFLLEKFSLTKEEAIRLYRTTKNATQ